MIHEFTHYPATHISTINVVDEFKKVDFHLKSKWFFTLQMNTTHGKSNEIIQLLQLFPLGNVRFFQV